MADEPKDPQLAFEKARYEYVTRLYEKEVKRSEGLETRANFYFSFITLILGALFLKFDFLDKIKAVAAKGQVPGALIAVLLVAAAVLGLSLLASMLSILAFARLQAYRPVDPSPLVDSLFSPDSHFLTEKTEKGLYYAVAMGYALALEYNIGITDRKAGWVRLSSVGIFFTVVSLSVILIITAYLLLAG